MYSLRYFSHNHKFITCLDYKTYKLSFDIVPSTVQTKSLDQVAAVTTTWFIDIVNYFILTGKLDSIVYSSEHTDTKCQTLNR